MAQTPDGYLWVGSFSGLTRFNGIRFSPDHEVVTPEFRDVMVLELLADPDGVLWVGTNNAIFRRQGEKWRHYGDDEGVPKGLVAGLARDSHGRLFAMVGQKLLRHNGDRFEIWLPQPPDANNQKPWSLLVDADDQIWLMADRNLAYFADESWHSFSPEEWGKGELVVQGFAAAKTGGIWVADPLRIRRWHDGEWVQTIERPADHNQEAVKLHEDQWGNLWMAGYHNGVVVYRNDGTWLECTMADGLLNNALPVTSPDLIASKLASINDVVRLLTVIISGNCAENALFAFANV